VSNTVVLGDVWEFGIVCSTVDQYSINVRHYRVSATAGASVDDESAIGALSGFVEGPYKAMLSSQARFHGVFLQRLKPNKTARLINKLDAGPGEVDDELLPRQTAGVVKLRSGVAGRSKRGRVYLPFMAESFNSVAGQPTAAALTAMTNVAAALTTTRTVGAGGNTAVFIPVIFSRKNNTTEDIAGYAVRGRWGTQRRRSDLNRPDADPIQV